MSRLNDSALTAPASDVVVKLVRGFFDEAEDALARLQADGDEEALHDFRVAVRRLRSTERAYRRCLGGGALGKFRKRLKRVANTTGRLRDLDVQLAWLEHEQSVMRSHERPGFEWLVGRLTAARQVERKSVRKKLGKHFGKLASAMVALEPGGKHDAREAYALAAGKRIQHAMEALGSGLRKLLASGGEAFAHQARIDAKRLRYLVEPLRGVLPVAEPLVDTLKGLQDLLGDLHDRQTLRVTLRDAAEQAGAEHFRRLIDLSATVDPEDPAYQAAREQDERAGLARLAREVSEQQEDLMLKLRAQLESGVIEQLEGQTGALLDALDAAA